MLVRTRIGRRWRALLVVVALVVGVVGAPNSVAIAAPGDVGYQGPSYSGASNPTEQKPESKLWFNDGSWWGSLFDAVSKKYQIQRLDLSTQTWQTTGVLIDTRANTRADVLWDGSKLYVASHVYSTTPASGYPARLYRYSYSSATKTYSLDAGFPATISDYRSETLVIDKDSTGKLWATWTEGNKVWVNRTIGNDSTWGTPFTPSLTGAATLKPDDISSLVAFGPGKIGLMWSNQNASTMYFSVHDDAAVDTSWGASETAIGGSKNADDHINLKTDGSGRVLAITKTSQTVSAATIIAVLVRGTNGSWTNYPAWRVSDVMTRPILVYDETNQELRIFASRESGGTIYTKRSPLSTISFPVGLGDTYIKDATIDLLNNATSTKQNLTSSTGMVVLASQNSDKRYWHNYDPLGGSGPPPPPPPAPPSADFTATPTSGQANLAVSFSDASTGAPTSWSWAFGDGDTSTAQNPSHTYTTAGTYTVTLTATNAYGSNAKTRTDYITVTAAPPPGSTLTFTPVADAHVRSTSPTSNYGLDAQLRVRDGSSDGSVTFNAYLKFDVTGVTSSIASATLRLWVDTGTANGGTLYPTTNSWTEAGLTWNTAPAIGSNAIAGIGRTTTGTWVDIPLGAGAVVPNASNSFGIRSVTTSSGYYSSRQGANPPQLVITLSGGEPPPPPPPAPPTADFTATPTSGQANLAVTFTDASTGGPTSWAWTFGDGGTSMTQNPSYTYTTAGTYTVSLTATNAAGSDTKTRTDYITVTAAPPPPPPGSTLTFTPVADTHVKSTSATSNYGSDTTLRVRDGTADGTATYRPYVQFDVTGISGSVASVTLRLFVVTKTNDGGSVYAAASNWTETGLTWNTQPTLGSTGLGAIGPTTAGTWVEIPLGAAAVSANGTYSFAVLNASTTSGYYSSREGANPAQLVVTLSN